MESEFGFFEGWAGGIIIVFLLVWAMLNFLAPFFWYGTNKRAREISEKMDELIDLQRQRVGEKQSTARPGSRPSGRSIAHPEKAPLPVEKRNVRDGWQS